MQACTKTHHFEIKNAKNFCGEGQPLPRPTHPLSAAAYDSSIFAPTALKLNVTPLEENPSYGLVPSTRISGLLPTLKFY